MTLEETIQAQRQLIENVTHDYLMKRKPFGYLHNLSFCGERDYGVPYQQSFTQGVNESLDYYNEHVNEHTMWETKKEGLVQGAMTILRYVYKEAREIHEEPDGDID